MSILIKLPIQNYFLIEIPVDAKELVIINNNLFYQDVNSLNPFGMGVVPLPEGSILISPDISLIDNLQALLIAERYNQRSCFYKDYLSENCAITAIDSIRSAFNSVSVKWRNELEEPIHSEYVSAFLNDNFNRRNKQEEYEMDLEKWNESQNKIKRYCLINRKNTMSNNMEQKMQQQIEGALYDQATYFADEHEQAVSRGGEDYARAYIEGLEDGINLAKGQSKNIIEEAHMAG